MNKFFSILKYLIPYWFTALLSIVFNLLAAIFSVISFTMVIPFLGLLFSAQEFVPNAVNFDLSVEAIRHNFNYYLGQVVSDKGQIEALFLIILIVFISTVLKSICLYIGKLFVMNIRIGVVKDVRNNLLNKILNFDLSYFSDEKRGDIISKMIVDVKEIEISIISSLEILFKDPVLISVYLLVLLSMSSELTLIVVLIFPLTALIIGQLGKSLKKNTIRGLQRMGALVGVLEETLSGIKIIKAFGAESLVENRFKKLNQNYSNLFKNVWRRRTLANPLSDILTTISILLIMWFGGKMVLNSDGNFSSQIFIGYLAVFTQIVSPVRSFSGAYYNVIKGMASVERINTILLHEFKIANKPNAIKLNELNNRIEFKDIGFAYEEDSKLILNGVNFAIKKGQSVALVGHSGSGKSTIVDLIPRFFDPIEGEVLIDGISLKEYDIDSLRKQFGYVNQEPILFNETIYNNILFGNLDASEEQVLEAARLSFAHDFIIEKDLAYHTNLGEDGGKLSLGEKQRISIARAILKNAPILILDEATSALDLETELIVRKALRYLMKDKTTIVIAHRLSTIKSVDKILVVDQGKIVEQGTHEELLNLNKHYKKLTQFEFL